MKRKLSAKQKDEEEGSDESKQTVESGAFRTTVRETMIEFAKDVAYTENRGEVIEVVENVDEYVDRIMEKA